MTTNNAGSWADEMDRTRPFSDSTKSDGQPEGSLNPVPLEVGKTTTNVAKPEGDNSGTEVQMKKTEVKKKLRGRGPEYRSRDREQYDRGPGPEQSCHRSEDSEPRGG